MLLLLLWSVVNFDERQSRFSPPQHLSVTRAEPVDDARKCLCCHLPTDRLSVRLHLRAGTCRPKTARANCWNEIYFAKIEIYLDTDKKRRAKRKNRKLFINNSRVKITARSGRKTKLPTYGRGNPKRYCVLEKARQNESKKKRGRKIVAEKSINIIKLASVSSNHPHLDCLT